MESNRIPRVFVVQWIFWFWMVFCLVLCMIIFCCCLLFAIRILSSPQLAVPYADYANELIKFVSDADTLYGKQTLVYNVIASFTLLLMLKNWDL